MTARTSARVVVRTAQEQDLERADAVLHAAFDAVTGRNGHLGDADLLGSRWRTDRERVFVADLDGEVVGSNAVTVRGTTGWFGPLSVDPRVWGRGLAHPLVEEADKRLRLAGATRTGLFTFAGSPLHLSLYARHGYWPGALMLVLRREVPPGTSVEPDSYAARTDQQRRELLGELAALTDAVEPGWDLTEEVVATSREGLGDTVVVHDVGGLAGAAVLQSGLGSDAPGGTCRVEAAVVRPGPGAGARMTLLLDAVDAVALRRDAGTVVVTVSAADEGCCRLLLARGHTVLAQGVAMHRGGAGHHRAGAWVLDDWR